MEVEKVIVVRDKTRLEQLIERYNTKAQAKFYLERTGGDFAMYEAEHQQFYQALGEVTTALDPLLKHKVVERQYLPSYLFGETDAVLVLGQDGLVANAAKYVGALPLIGVNPNPAAYDGVLLPYHPAQVSGVVQAVMQQQHTLRRITMAQAVLHDGQRLLAFNDLFVGAATHVSARYSITYREQTERQSSSGVLVATGAGSTGWLSSVFNMAHNVLAPGRQSTAPFRLAWEDPKLAFVVREPFRSRVTQTELGFGTIDAHHTLKLVSHMPAGGVIFSDGIEADFLPFHAGSTVEIGLAPEKAHLVVPSKG